MAVLDTNFLIALEAREARAAAWLRAHGEDEHVVPDFVAVEYLTGHSEHEEALEVLDASFRITHGDLEWVRSSVGLRKALRRKKVRFRSPDFWVAAWANHLGTSVLTRNTGHFRDLSVPVETW